MRSILSVLFVAFAAAVIGACGGSEAVARHPSLLDGGWEFSEDTVLASLGYVDGNYSLPESKQYLATYYSAIPNVVDMEHGRAVFAELWRGEFHVLVMADYLCPSGDTVGVSPEMKLRHMNISVGLVDSGGCREKIATYQIVDYMDARPVPRLGEENFDLVNEVEAMFRSMDPGVATIKAFPLPPALGKTVDYLCYCYQRSRS